MKRATLVLAAALLSFAARGLRADGPADAPRAAAPDSPNSSQATAAPKPAGNAFDPHLASSTEASGPGSGSQDGFFRSWLKRVGRTQAEQPHWITPVVTVTPRLEQEFRYDISQQTQANGTTILRNFGGSKGLEIIPIEHAELIFSPPPFITRSFNGVPDGYGDVSFLLKYRFLSATEEAGNYIFTAFLGGSIPTGSHTNGARDATVTPTLAAGKGWGNFDVTTTFGAVLPVSETNLIGRQVVWNTAFQYRVIRKIWPEVEVNSTFFSDGPNDGKKADFLDAGSSPREISYLAPARIYHWRRCANGRYEISYFQSQMDFDSPVSFLSLMLLSFSESICFDSA